MILIDIEVVSETMRRSPDPVVIEWLDAQAAETLHLAMVRMAELRSGIAVLPEGRRKVDLGRSLSVQAVAMFGERILPFDLPAAEAYAAILPAHVPRAAPSESPMVRSPRSRSRTS